MKLLAPSLFLAIFATAPLAAHEFERTSVAVVLDSSGGFQVELSIDADALALGLPLDADAALVSERINALSPAEFDAAVGQANRALADLVVVAFDGAAAGFTVEFPQHGTPAAAQADPPTVLGTLARLRGQIPADAGEMTFRADERLKIIDLRIFDPAAQGVDSTLLRPGETSPPHRLGGGPQIQTNVFARYLMLGFEHILPKGLDHILFVIGLFLLSTHWKPLLLQVTAFTLAHSATLALSMLEIVSLPTRPVESLIALSIAYVAVENLFTSELKPWRPFVVFGFGLLHGLGFAGVLAELGTPEDRFLSALIGFNLGVEGGQLAVLALAFAAVGWLRDRPSYRKAVVVPASVAIAAVGLYWAVERAFL